jgi:hypothetical protein
VFLAYASRFGQALIDRRLYLPETWRCGTSGAGERPGRGLLRDEAGDRA